VKPSTSSTLNRVVLDLTSVRPTSGGVGSVATGVANGLSASGIEHECLVEPAAEAEWSRALDESSASTIAVAAVQLRAGSRWQEGLRSILPASWKTSAPVAFVRLLRSRSTRSSIGQRTVWQPFHRAPLATDNGIVTVHDLRVFEPGMQSRMDQDIIRKNVARAKAVVCSWPHPYGHLLEMFPDAANKAFMVSLPVLLPGHPPSRRRQLSTPVRLLYPAAVTPHKNHETLIRAMTLLPDAVLVCTGGAVAQHAAKLRELADSLGVADRIQWRGYVCVEELEAEYRGADVLVMPTRWEAASGPILEAVARELPFVASDIAPLRSQMAHMGITMPTFPWNIPEALADAVRLLTADYPRYVEETRVPGVTVRARTWQDCALDYARVFAWVDGTGPRPDDLAPTMVPSGHEASGRTT
jgi:glycosyltransferase involved in cell wall biosynthesis